MSMFQVGQTEIGDDNVVAAGDVANAPLNSTEVSKDEEELSLDLTIGLKY